MQTILGSITITHESDWTGDATLSWNDGSAVLPGGVLFELLTSMADGESAGRQLLSEVLTIKRDFEFLRRQASAFRLTVQSGLEQMNDRLSTLEAK